MSDDLTTAETVTTPAGDGAAAAAPPATAAPPAGRRRWRAAVVAAAAVTAVVFGAAGGLVWLAKSGDLALAAVAPPAGAEAPSSQDLRRLEARLAAVTPRGVHIIVDTVENRLVMRRRDKSLLEAPCSTGTGAVLADPASGRRWVFDTPKGAHRVRIKLRDPVWKKPDWAFIEEGKPVPQKNSEERFDFDALGDYGLYFGDGYLIHGTLYQRLLGRSVTHGCIRLGDDDLETVYRTAPVGTPIYIF